MKIFHLFNFEATKNLSNIFSLKNYFIRGLFYKLLLSGKYFWIIIKNVKSHLLSTPHVVRICQNLTAWLAFLMMIQKRFIWEQKWNNFLVKNIIEIFFSCKSKQPFGFKIQMGLAGLILELGPSNFWIFHSFWSLFYAFDRPLSILIFPIVSEIAKISVSVPSIPEAVLG